MTEEAHDHCKEGPFAVRRSSHKLKPGGLRHGFSFGIEGLLDFAHFDIAWTPLLQAYPVEIFPYTLRGRGLSVTYITAFTGLIIGNQVNPIAMKSIAWKYYIVFCCILGLLLGLIWFLFPETKGHTLEEIREVFEGKPEGKEKDIEGADVDEVTKEGRVKQVELA